LASGRLAAFSERTAAQPSTLARFAEAYGHSGFSGLQAAPFPFSPLVFNTRAGFDFVESDFEGFRTQAAAMTVATVVAVAVVKRRRLSDSKNFHSDSG
jgi:DNA-binding MurR/RpiR family transcriptional regulator